MGEKTEALLLGLAAGDAVGASAETGGPPQAGNETALALCSAAAIRLASPGRRVDEVSEAAGIDRFMAELSRGLASWAETSPKGGTTLHVLAACDALAFGAHWSLAGAHGGKSAPLSMAMPIGAWLGVEGVPRIVRFSQAVAAPFSAHDSVSCSSVAAAAMAALATGDVPVGTWANEVMGIAGGISPEVSKSIELAAELAASRASPGEAMSAGVLGTGWQAHEEIGCALFCCMTWPGSLDAAVRMASLSGNVRGVSALVGACMAAKLGAVAIPSAWLEFEGIDKVRAAAKAFGEAGHGEAERG